MRSAIRRNSPALDINWLKLLTGACALLFAGTTVASHETPVPAAISAVVPLCESCHGPQGISQNGSVPSLAGQHEVYLSNRLYQYQRPDSPSVLMSSMVTALDGSRLKAIAQYYARLPYVRHPQLSDEEKAQRGVGVYQKLCHLCHRDEGKSSPYAEYPLIAGQGLDYMQSSIRSILAGERKVDLLKRELLDLASPQQIDDAVHFFASQVVRPGELVRQEEKKKLRRRTLTTFQ